jgi:hypothetical protein
LFHRASKYCFVFPANHLNNAIASYINLDNLFKGSKWSKYSKQNVISTLPHKTTRKSKDTIKETISVPQHMSLPLISSDGNSARAEARHGSSETESVLCYEG